MSNNRVDQLEKSDQTFFQLAENIPVLICAFRGSHFSYVNPALQTLSEYSEKELIKMNWWEPIAPEFRGMIRARGLARQRGEAVPDRYEVKIISKHGREIWLEFFFSSVQERDKDYVVVGAYDITERKRAQEELQQAHHELDQRVQQRTIELSRANRGLTLLNTNLESVIMNMSDGVVVLDQKGTIEILNPVLEKVWGGLIVEVEENLRKAILGKSTRFIEPMLSNGKAFRDEEVILTTSKGAIHCLASGTPVHVDQPGVNRGVIIIRPIKEVHKLVNRFSGAQASFTFKDIISCDEKMQASVEMARTAASSSSNVLIEGESGTGKEMFAQAIHNASDRHGGPFVAVNCGAIPRELIGSELFGYVEGAFTGAKRGGNAGKFELASGGSLFLDEIGEMPFEQQVSLLRVIQEKAITRIGGHKVIPVDVRIICATNKDLHEELRKGNFRQDLYYRLNVFFVRIPPLREHRDDIPLLFKHFRSSLHTPFAGNREDPEDEKILGYLKRYDWPGNVRELQNCVERMTHMANGSNLGLGHLPAEILTPASYPSYSNSPELDSGAGRGQSSLKDTVRDLERQQIMDLLLKCNGNVTQVAQEMGTSRRTVYRKIKLLGIEH